MANSTMKKIGVVIGCRDVVFAKLKTDTAEGTTYEDDLFYAPGVIELAFTSQITDEKLGADDVPVYDNIKSLDSMDVSLTMASVGADGKAYLLGGKQDSKGVLLESSDDDAPYVAMGFKTARSDGSDDYVWLPKGKFAQGDSTFRTKEQGTVNWQTPVLTGTFVPRISDKRLRASVNTKEEKAASILQTFFGSVYETPAESGS